MITIYTLNFLCFSDMNIYIYLSFLVSLFPGDYVKLKIHTPMYTIAKALASPNSGLEVKDRVWLKITIPKSFIGKQVSNKHLFIID